MRGRCCNIIVLNMHAPNEKKCGDPNHSSYEELKQVFEHFSMYTMKILWGYFNAKLGREGNFKPTIGNDSQHQDLNDNGVRIVNFVTSKKNPVVKSTMFPHRIIHRYIWTSPDVKTHNQTDHLLRDRRRYWSIRDVRSFREADCDTGHYLVAAKLGKDWQ